MKKILSLILFATMMATNGAFAQNVLVADLDHEGTITHFYGAEALVNAHNAAAHGDIITLSIGTFVPPTITKALTINGVGMEYNNEGQTTALSDDITINITDDVDESLHIQGIYTNSRLRITKTTSNSQILKCRLAEVEVRENTEMSFVHCKISKGFIGGSSQYDGLKNLYNCYIHGAGTTLRNLSAYNCVIDYLSSPATYNCLFYNSIIICSASSLSSTNTAFNCVGIGYSKLFQDILGDNNSISTYDTIFKSFTGTYSDSVSFELTDDAKTTYLGNDGTQVGIYGTTFPFDPTPAIPLITNYQVATKAVSGKVSVNIEINGGTE